MLSIVGEVWGATYQALLIFAASMGGSFSLVTRPAPFGTSAEHDEILEDLRPFLMDEAKTKRWPGSRLGRGRPAIMRRYRWERTALPVLGRVEGLYGWVQSRFPEDLSFYAVNGQGWLYTTTHESLGYIDEQVADVQRLRREVPGLVLRPSTRGHLA